LEKRGAIEIGWRGRKRVIAQKKRGEDKKQQRREEKNKIGEGKE